MYNFKERGILNTDGLSSNGKKSFSQEETKASVICHKLGFIYQ